MDIFYSKHFCEIVCFDLVTSAYKLRFFLIYRPPDTNFQMTKHLTDHIKSYMLPHCRNLILGDLNCPKVNWLNRKLSKDKIQDHFFQFCLLNEYSQMVDCPTHISSRGTANILDIILSQQSELIEDVKIGAPLLNSDHLSVSFNLSVSSDAVMQQSINASCERRLNFSKANIDNICREMISFRWDRQFSHFLTLQAKYDHFLKVSEEIIRGNTPDLQIAKARYPKDIRKLLNKKKRGLQKLAQV